MRPWYNTRTSRSDHCWGDRGRGLQAAEAALNSAAALAAAHTQASNQATIEDVDDHRRDGAEPDGLLSVDFFV